MTENYIYLDNAAATFIDPVAHQALTDAFAADFINLSGTHPLAESMQKQINQIRQDILNWLQAGSDYQMIFTSSATESNNTVIRGLALQSGDHIAFSEIDHPSQSMPCKAWTDHGVELLPIPVDQNGQYAIDTFIANTSKAPKLICLTQVSSLAGTYNDCDQQAQQLKQAFPDCHIHVDAAQAFTKMPLSMQSGAIDSLSIASYKLGGPKGVAGLALKKQAQLNPLLLGGQQEYGRRASSTATPLIIGMHAGIQTNRQHHAAHHQHVLQLNQYVRKQLQGSDIQIPFTLEHTSPYLLMLVTPKVPAAVMSRHLEQEKIIVNTRTSCSAKSNKPTPMLSALHLTTDLHRHVIRVSFSHHNTQAEIERFCDVLLSTYKRLSLLSR